MEQPTTLDRKQRREACNAASRQGALRMRSSPAERASAYWLAAHVPKPLWHDKDASSCNAHCPYTRAGRMGQRGAGGWTVDEEGNGQVVRTGSRWLAQQTLGRCRPRRHTPLSGSSTRPRPSAAARNGSSRRTLAGSRQGSSRRRSTRAHISRRRESVPTQAVPSTPSQEPETSTHTPRGRKAIETSTQSTPYAASPPDA